MSKRKLFISVLLILTLVFILAACDTAKEYTLKISATEGGTVNPKPGTHKYKENTVVDLKVTADEGYEFSKWEGDKVAVVNAEKGEYRIKMDGNKSIKAVFVEITEEPGEPGEPGGEDPGEETGEPVEPVIVNFESYKLEDELAYISWNPADAEAVIAEDPLNSENKVLKFTAKNYNAFPVIEMTLPEGTTLANYKKFTFKGYFAEGDVGWKTIYVAVFTEKPSSALTEDNEEIIGSWYRAAGKSSDWEDITVDIEKSKTDITGHIYVVFGMSTKGTESGAEEDTIWYADDITLSN